MEPADQDINQGKKIRDLEQELNDLRQGLTVVTDYYRDLKTVSQKQDAVEAVDLEITRQLVDDEMEFEGIWRFHEEMLVGDLSARVPSQQMYDAFVRYCQKTGREPVERDAFEFVFARMENPVPEMDRGVWSGYRLRTDGS
jgi:hypothetical protein